MNYRIIVKMPRGKWIKIISDKAIILSVVLLAMENKKIDLSDF